MICSACGASNAPGARTCEQCEGAVPASCASCGKRLSSFERFDNSLCILCRTERVPEAIEPDELFPPEAPAASATPAPFATRPPFIGRRPIVEALMRALDTSVDDNQLGFCVVIGEPGMGKSRAVEEFARAVAGRDSDIRFLVGASDTSNQPYAALSRVLAARFGITRSDPPGDAREKVAAGVSEVMRAPLATETSHLIAHLMRCPFPNSPVVTALAESPQQLESRTFIALKRFLAADAGEGPLVLCFENLEHSGSSTINLLHYLAAGLSESPVLLVGTARATLFERHPSFGEGDVPLQRIDVGPMSEAESVALLRAMCRPLPSLPDALVQHAGKLGGSPRALLELVRLLVETRVIARTGSGWTLDTAALARTGLPDSHESLVAARVKHMSDTDRAVLEKAAAVGETCWFDSLVALFRDEAIATSDPDGPTLGEIAAAGDDTRVRVGKALSSLIEAEWLIEVDDTSVTGEREYRFAYPFAWRSVYAGIPEQRRRRYHQRIAQWLELRPDGREGAIQEEIGRHLELAGDSAAAARRCRRAADAARANFFNRRAVRLYAHALECLGASDLPERIQLWHDLGSVYELTGDYKAALGAFERMLRLAWVGASRTKAAVAFNKMGRVWRRKGDLPLALEYLRRGQSLFEQAGDARGIAGSLDDIGSVLLLEGRYDEAFECVTRALSRRGKHGDKRSIAQSLSTLGIIQQLRGRFPESLNCHTQSLDLRRAISDRAGVIMSLNNLGVLASLRGDFPEAREGWEQALSESEDIGALPLQALALCNLGELALLEHRHEEARRRLEDGLSIAEALDDRQLEAEATRCLALLDHQTGDSERARTLATRARDIARDAGLRENEGRALLTMAEVRGGALFDAGDTEADSHADQQTAQELFERGIQIMRDLGNDAELARGLEAYGRFTVEHGDSGVGRGLLEEALAIYTRVGIKNDVRRTLDSM